MRWSYALAGLFLLFACAPDTSSQDPSAGAALELQNLLEEGVAAGIPGISAAVATSEGVVWSGVAGKADLEAGTPVGPEMLFGIGSITKTFVAVVILQLAEEGLLDLNATVGSILGAAVDGIPNAQVATLAQLLNHTGGVPSWEDDPAWVRDGRGSTLNVDRVWGKTETLPYIQGHEPLDAPGAAYSYANTNYTLLGMVIEEVTGEDAVVEIHRRILDPLGLEDIYLEGFEPVPAGQLPRRYHWATPTFRQDAGVNEAFAEVRADLIDASPSNLSVEWTAGGMVASARDLALYAVALRDGRLLQPESMAFLLDWFPAGEGRQVGHNVFRTEYSDELAIIGHSGSVLGFTGSLYWVEGADVVVAVVANVGTMHSGRVPGSAGSVARNRAFIQAAMRVAAGGRGRSGSSGGGGAREGSTSEGSGYPSAPDPDSYGQLIYVPAYSHIYHIRQGKDFQLTVTLSIRNPFPWRSITINRVDYFDSTGNFVRSYLSEPRSLGPLETLEYVVAQDDDSGGSGANFLVGWNGEEGESGPIAEAVMIGTDSGQGLSFMAVGRPVRRE